MKATHIGLPATIVAAPALAPVLSAQESLADKRDKKLASAFLDNGNWFTDYDKARAEAKKTGKPIFGYFTRSFEP